MAIILGLKSSCDDSAAALVTGDRQVLAQAIVGQNEAHRPFGGVVPEIAARAHVEILPGLIRQVLAEADVAIGEVDAIAATAGPGLIGGVMVALLAGKGLSLATGKPLIAVNHLEGHALSPRLVDPDLAFPYLLLLASGGHCQLLEVRGVGDYRRLATTIDDAAGEAFDKAAKLLGLPYPGGPAIEELARDGDPQAVPLPRPLVGSGEPHFSFAGLKSAVQRAVASRHAQARRHRRQLPAGDGRLHGRPHGAGARAFGGADVGRRRRCRRQPCLAHRAGRAGRGQRPRLQRAAGSGCAPTMRR